MTLRALQARKKRYMRIVDAWAMRRALVGATICELILARPSVAEVGNGKARANGAGLIVRTYRMRATLFFFFRSRCFVAVLSSQQRGTENIAKGRP
jgi:hypothetical protein